MRAPSTPPDLVPLKMEASRAPEASWPLHRRPVPRHPAPRAAISIPRRRHSSWRHCCHMRRSLFPLTAGAPVLRRACPPQRWQLLSQSTQPARPLKGATIMIAPIAPEIKASAAAAGWGSAPAPAASTRDWCKSGRVRAAPPAALGAVGWGHGSEERLLHKRSLFSLDRF